MGEEPEITQVEKVSSDSLPLDKSSKSKCANNVGPKNKDGDKNKRIDSKKEVRESRKRRYSPSEDSSDDSDPDSESSDDEDGAPVSSDDSSDDEDSNNRFSTKSSKKKNGWKIDKKLNKLVKKKFLKHIPDQEIKDSILDENPAPSNFISKLKLDDYLQEILSEAGKKDEIFSDRTLMKAQGNLINIMGPLGRLLEYLDHLKSDDKGVIDLDLLMKLVDQCVVLVGVCHSRASYYRRQRILVSLFKDRRKVKSILKEGAKCFQKEEKVLFGEKFQKKVNETIKSKKKTKELLREYSSKPTRAKKPFYGYQQQPFRGSPQSTSSSGRGHQSFQNQGFPPRDGQRRFFSRGGRGKQPKLQPPYDTLSQQDIKSKNTRPFKFKRIQKHSPICKNAFPREQGKFSSSRKIKIFLEKLGKSNKRQNNSKHSKRISYRICRDSLPTETASKTKVTKNSDKSGDTRGERTAGKGCHKESSSLQGPVYQQSLSCRKEGWGTTTSNKSEGPKHLYPVPTFQNGRALFGERNFGGRGLFMQIRPQGCILLCSIGQTFQEICTFRVGWFPLRIPMSLLWPRSSSKVVHKTNQSPHFHSSQIVHKDNSLPRRFPNIRQNFGTINTEPGHCHLLVGKPRICDKLEEISVGTNAKNRVFGNGHRFCGDDSVSSSGESRIDFQKVSGYVVNAGSNNKRSIKAFGNSLLHSFSNSSSPIVHEIPAETTDPQSLLKEKLQQQSNSGSPLQRGINVVDIKPKSVKREVYNFSQSRTYDTVRCIKNRVGSILPKDINRGCMVTEGTSLTHQCPGIKSSKVCHPNILQVQEGSSSPLTNGQPSSISLFGENGGNKKFSYDSRSKGNMGILYGQSDHTYCRVPPWDFKYQSRQSFQGNETFVKRMDIEQNNFSESGSSHGASRCGSVCIQVVSSDTKVHKLATRSTCLDGRCISNKLGASKSLCLPTICSNRESSGQSDPRQKHSDNNNTGLAITNMVHSVTENEYSTSITNPTLTKPSDRPKRKTTSVMPKSHTSFGGLESLREQYTAEGLSGQTIELLESSRRQGTLYHYKTGWGKWSSWCLSRKVDPLCAGVKFVLEFLSSLFSEGLEYSTINGYRSAISAYHERVEGSPIGQHPKICQLLSGVFNKRPPQPRYTVIWDVSKVVNYMSTLGSNENLSPKLLTLKLTTLLALLSSGRAHELTFLDIRYKVVKKNSVIFHFSKLTKSWKQGQKPPTFELSGFDQPDLCVLKCLERYLLISEGWRDEDTNQLLLSHIKPHRPVSIETVSRWLQQFLKLSGIDTSIFKGHSTRSASASKSKQVGLSLPEILKRGQWSNQTTFEIFYNKPIIDSRPSVEILKGK